MSKYGVWLYERGTDPAAGRWLKDENRLVPWCGSKEDAEFHAGNRNERHHLFCYEVREFDAPKLPQNRED